MDAESRTLLYDLLDKLCPDELNRFKALLSGGVEGFRPIPSPQLGKTSTEVVEKMMKVYGGEILEVILDLSSSCTIT